VHAAQTGFLAGKAADQLAVFTEDRDGTTSALFGDVDQPLGTTVDIAGRFDVVPDMEELPFAVEELDAIVCPVADQDPALRVDADLVYESELTRLGPRRSPRELELAFG